MKIFYLYSELMDYSLATITELASFGINIHVVHWDIAKKTPYKITPINNVIFYNRSTLNAKSIATLIKVHAPDLIVISGWMDAEYLKVVRNINKSRIKIVCGFDDLWRGTIKQNIARLLGFFGFFSRYFTHAWVCGPSQYEYARKLGFNNDKIIYDLYSANLPRIYSAKIKRNQINKTHPHTFLYVGRFAPEKGLSTLLDAWKLLEPDRQGWKLILVGNGRLPNNFKKTPNISIYNFMQPDELSECYLSAGCLIMPSTFEPWGVVLHEAAAAGLPLIASNAVDSAKTFLISGYNGYLFEVSSSDSLVHCMKKVINKSDFELECMSNASLHLSKRITPSSSASNLLSILNL